MFTHNQVQIAVAAAKRQFDLIRKKYPDLQAYLVLSLPGGQTEVGSSPKEILKEFPSMVMDISDFRMPQIYGDEVLKRLRCINPNVALLLVTGSKEFLPTDFLKQGLRGLVEKPFRLDELVKQVNESVASVAL